MAVNKHGHDSVEVLPVPIKQQRDHHNERCPWHNWDSSQRKPGGWSGREGSKRGKKKKKHNINTTSILWGNCQLLVGHKDLNLNVNDYLFRPRMKAYRRLWSSLLVFYFCKQPTCEMIKKNLKTSALCTDREGETDLQWGVRSLDEITDRLRVGKHMFWAQRRTMTALHHVLTCVKQHGIAQC